MSNWLPVVAFAICCLSCRPNAQQATSFEEETKNEAAETESIPSGAEAIIASFPGYVLEYRNDSIVFRNGCAVAYDDGKEKTFIESLDDTDVDDMFREPYCRDSIPQYLSDVGRARAEAFYKALYGSSPSQVMENLVQVDWFGQQVLFTSINDANLHLEEVAGELKAIPELKRYLTNASTFYWRTVRGSDRLSAHSYGIAIDINVTYSNYWRWSSPHAGELDFIDYQNQIPMQIVEVFEKHGFIWGGRWYHFDTMHFEYRPEILYYAKKEA